MTKEQVEKSIAEQLRGIWATYLKFNPNGRYLNLSVVDGTLMVWDEVENQKLNFFDKV